MTDWTARNRSTYQTVRGRTHIQALKVERCATQDFNRWDRVIAEEHGVWK